MENLKRISRFHRHAIIAEKVGREWGAIGEFRLRFLTNPNREPQLPRRKTETKKPSVSVDRGVINMPSPERRAALQNMTARSPSACAVCWGGSTTNAECRERNARTCAPFSSTSTEQVM